MGRKPKSGSWKYFGVAINAAGKKVAVCDHCNWETTINATRLTNHIISKCQKVPQTIRDEVISLEGQQKPKKINSKKKPGFRKKKAGIITDLEVACFNSPEDLEGPPVKRYALPSTSEVNPPSFPDRMRLEENETLREMFAKAVYATGIPFSIFEHPAWNEFFTRLRPTFKVPSRFDLAGNLLDEIYNNLSSSSQKLLSETDSLGISIDSSSNIFLYTPEPLFLKSIEAGSDTLTGEYIAKQLEEVIEEKGDLKFMGVTTDSESRMKLAGKTLEEKFPWISWYSCFIDSLNLLLTDICREIPSVKEVIAVCSAITRQINTKPKLLTLFREKQKAIRSHYISLKTPGKSRFASSNRCIQAVVVNQLALHALATDVRLVQKNGKKTECLLSTNLKEDILDEGFWSKIEDVLNIIKPVEKWRTKVQYGDIPISHAVIGVKEISDTILKVLDSSESFENEEWTIKAILSNWKEMCLQPIHYAATRLDPSMGDNLTPDENGIAWNYLSKVVSSLPDLIDNYKVKNEIMENYNSFISKQGVFAVAHLWQLSVKPHVWWKEHFGTSVLGQIASKILFLPLLSVVAGRFSARGRICSKIRMGSQNKRAEKLVYLHQNLKLLSKIKSDETANENYRADYSNGDVDNATGPDFEYEEAENDAENEGFVNDVEAETYIVIYDETAHNSPHHTSNDEVNDPEPKSQYVTPYIPDSG